MRRFRIVASLALFFVAPVAIVPVAMAQHGGGMSGRAVAGRAVSAGSGVVAAAPHAVGAAPHAISAAPRAGAPFHAAPGRTSVSRVAIPPGGSHPIGVNGGVNGSTVPGQRINMMSGLGNLPLFPTSFGNTPGLGFDYPHLAALNSGRQFSRFHRRFNDGEGFGFSGFLLSPEVIVEQQPVDYGPPGPDVNPNIASAGPDNGASLQDQFLPSSGVSGAPAPPQEIAEYVFVRRDGTLLFGVAFSWDHGTLHYITRDGVRRSISQDALDMDATQQFNEQRGVSFRLPA
jgi:hypothetical protein